MANVFFSRKYSSDSIPAATSANLGGIFVASDGTGIWANTTGTTSGGFTQIAISSSEVVRLINNEVSGQISQIGAIMHFKGTKTAQSELPSTGQKSGDVWVVTADNGEYVWTGSAWEKFGTTNMQNAIYKGSGTYANDGILIASGTAGAVITKTAAELGIATNSAITELAQLVGTGSGFSTSNPVISHVSGLENKMDTVSVDTDDGTWTWSDGNDENPNTVEISAGTLTVNGQPVLTSVPNTYETATTAAGKYIAKSTFTAAEQLLIGNGSGTYKTLSIPASDYAGKVLTISNGGAISWSTPAESGVLSITAGNGINVSNGSSSNPTVAVKLDPSSMGGVDSADGRPYLATTASGLYVGIQWEEAESEEPGEESGE